MALHLAQSRGEGILAPELVGRIHLLKGSNGLQEIWAGQGVASVSDAPEKGNQGAVWSHKVPVSSVGSEVINSSNEHGVTSGKPEDKKGSPKI